ncbi:histidine phosphatase superfamily [Staphylotrichum tortipilum]|uniref:Histidine phosphatase superfamily n=1 Tax=Staphylotrichum tortipilum TaxID=2831512 RepID=A0AAN6MCM9_9PEZI|nr:histidine phosphatase superfamily [Staphylotrichum longicolle]
MPVWIGVGVVTPLVVGVVMVDDLVDVVEDLVKVAEDCVEVVEDLVEAAKDCVEVVDVVTGTSSVASPMTQYCLLTSRAGQVIPVALPLMDCGTDPPLGGCQDIPVNGVASAASSSGSEDNTWLQGSSGCGNAVAINAQYFTSAEYNDTLANTAAFYKGLLPVINGTISEAQATFKNPYAIYDLIHVSEIHNATIPSSSLLTPETLHQLQTLADQHEWGLAYNTSSPIRAVSRSVLAAQILSSLNTTLTTSTKTSGLKMGIQFGAYGTFMAFFGLAQLPAASADFTGVVDYVSAFVPPAPADVSVRFLFSNVSAGLSEQGLQAFPLFGRAETTLPWTTFAEEMGKISLGDTADWCRACGNSTGVCAGTGASTSTTSSGGDGGEGGGGVSRPAAGAIGAVVAIVVVLLLEALVMRWLG